MADKKTTTKVEYLSRPTWGAPGTDTPESFDLTEITLIRRTTTYPVTKANAVQWQQGERVDETLAVIPTEDIADVVAALLNDVGWVASGKCRAERG